MFAGLFGDDELREGCAGVAVSGFYVRDADSCCGGRGEWGKWRHVDRTGIAGVMWQTFNLSG